MRLAILAMFVESSRTAVAMCAAGVALFLIGAWAAKSDVAQARGLEKIVALANLCYAVPLAVFGALHLFGPAFVKGLVPPYMPGRMFWVYFVGCALIAASLSIATKIAVRWSGLLVGIMMFMFVACSMFPTGCARCTPIFRGRAPELPGPSFAARVRSAARAGFLRQSQRTDGAGPSGPR